MPSRSATFNSRSAVGVYIDAFAGDLHQDDVAEYRRFPQESIEAAVREMEAVAISPDYTHSGKIVRLENLSAKALGSLKPLQDKFAKMERVIADLMANALTATKPNEKVNEDRQLEIRNRIEAKQLGPLEVMTKLLDAIAAGDQEFIAAVLNAPRAFPLLNDEGRKAALTAKIAQSPDLSERLSSAEWNRSFLAGLLTAARQDIEAAANFGTAGGTRAQGSGVPGPDGLIVTR
jgi:hypothetical protein